jgi:hypothetical protein
MPIAICYALWKLSGAILPAWQRWSHNLAQSLALPQEFSGRVLIVRTAGDEASAALGIAHLLSKLVTKMLRMIVLILPTSDLLRRKTVHRRIEAALWLIFSIFVLSLCACWVVSANASPEATENFTLVIVWYCIAVVAIPLALLTLLPVAWALCLLASLVAIPFGGGFAAAAIGLEVSVEPTPPGIRTVFQLTHSEALFSEQAGLAHSSHSDSRVTDEIARWLADPQYRIAYENRLRT